MKLHGFLRGMVGNKNMIWKNHLEQEILNDRTEPYCEGYLCPSCFKKFITKKKCESHYMTKCNVPKKYVDHVLAKKGNEGISVIRTNDPLNIKTTNEHFEKAGYNLMIVFKKEFGKDFKFIGRNLLDNEREYLIIEDKSSEVKGYVLFRMKKFKNFENKIKISWSLENVYIFPPYRKKDYASFLIETALKDLGEDLNTIFYYYPFTDPFREFLKSKGLFQVKIFLDDNSWTIETL